VIDLPLPRPLGPEDVVALLGDWERARLSDLARKVIHRLSRIRAAGLFAEYQYDSIWGEYSHDIQTGPYDDFSTQLEDMVDDACEAVAEHVAPYEMQLFDRLANACGDIDGMLGTTYLVMRLKEEVSSRAANRDLERYSDDYRWFENL